MGTNIADLTSRILDIRKAELLQERLDEIADVESLIENLRSQIRRERLSIGFDDMTFDERVAYELDKKMFELEVFARSRLAALKRRHNAITEITTRSDSLVLA